MTKRTMIATMLVASVSAFAADQPQLPAGHPEVAHRSPATMPASATGSLTVRVTQKTAKAPSPAGDKVIVHFYQGEKVIKHAEVAADVQGVARIDDIPLTREAVQAAIIVQHGKVSYNATSRIMNSGSPKAEVNVSVYESTAEAPAWRIPMRHLIVSRSDEGVRVVEMLAVDNPSDRTWIGTNEHEEGTTLMLRLPEGAGNLEVGSGFSQESLHFHNGTIFNIAPMTPGMTNYEFAYSVPVRNGKAEIPVTAPAMTQQLIVFLPDDGTEIKLNGLVEKGKRKGKDGEVRMLSAAGLPAGQAASVTILGLPETTVASAGGGWSSGQIVAAAGLGIVLLGGIGFMLLKPVKPRPETK